MGSRLQAYDQRRASIQTPRFLPLVAVFGPFLAVADRSQPVARDAARYEVVAYGGGTAITEREVVLRRADVAGMTFDVDAERRVAVERADRFVEDAKRLRPEG